jgi:hypothetical protein
MKAGQSAQLIVVLIFRQWIFAKVSQVSAKILQVILSESQLTRQRPKLLEDQRGGLFVTIMQLPVGEDENDLPCLSILDLYLLKT